MLRFKQYLIERSGHSGISNQIQNVLDLIGLDANTKKTLTDLQTDLDSTDRSYRQEKGYDSASRARQSEYAQRMRDIESEVRSIGDSRPIRNLDSENMRVRYQTSMDTEIDPKLPADLQQLQRNIRGAAFEKEGYVAPHEQITGRPPISASTPRLSDLEELERMGVVNAKNYRSDERGVLYRPGTLPSEEQRRATALKAQDVANIGGGPVSGNNPEAKQQRSDALRDYYTKSGKYAGRLTGIIPDETGQQFIARGQRGGTKVEPNIGYNASGPAPLAANPSLAAGTKMQQAAGQVKAVGGPLVAQLAGGLVAPYVQKAGEETGLIDALARGISAVVPNSLLAAGNSPAEDERADEQISANLRKMGIKSGRLAGPMGIDIGKK